MCGNRLSMVIGFATGMMASALKFPSPAGMVKRLFTQAVVTIRSVGSPLANTMPMLVWSFVGLPLGVVHLDNEIRAGLDLLGLAWFINIGNHAGRVDGQQVVAGAQQVGEP